MKIQIAASGSQTINRVHYLITRFLDCRRIGCSKRKFNSITSV